MSKQYENDLAKAIHDATDSNVRAYRCGFSGNNAMPQPDVLITTPDMNHAIEVKGPIASQRLYVDEEDIEQLVECQNDTTYVALVVKFQRRQPVVIRYYESMTNDGWNDLSAAEKLMKLTPEAFDAYVTTSGSLALNKPSTDDWPSARSGASDEDAVLSGLGVVTDKSIRATLGG
jgi:Holliday junction resolvase